VIAMMRRDNTREGSRKTTIAAAPLEKSPPSAALVPIPDYDGPLFPDMVD